MKDGPLLISTLSFEGTEDERVNRWSCMSISRGAAGSGKETAVGGLIDSPGKWIFLISRPHPTISFANIVVAGHLARVTDTHTDTHFGTHVAKANVWQAHNYSPK